MTKQWYLHVKDETMAPARMVQFIKDHVATCDICLADPDIQSEIEKITEIVLPESKIPKAVRLQQEKENEEAEYEDPGEENEDVGNTEEEEGEEGEEQEEYMDDDDELEDEDLSNLD